MLVQHHYFCVNNHLAYEARPYTGIRTANTPRAEIDEIDTPNATEDEVLIRTERQTDRKTTRQTEIHIQRVRERNSKTDTEIVIQTQKQRQRDAERKAGRAPRERRGRAPTTASPSSLLHHHHHHTTPHQHHKPPCLRTLYRPMYSPRPAMPPTSPTEATSSLPSQRRRLSSLPSSSPEGWSADGSSSSRSAGMIGSWLLPGFLPLGSRSPSTSGRKTGLEGMIKTLPQSIGLHYGGASTHLRSST